MVKNPSLSRTAMSPVLNHPSGVTAFAVAAGLLRYPYKKEHKSAIV
jgi:hypothetical protein